MKRIATIPSGAFSAEMHPAVALVSGDTCAPSTTPVAPCAATVTLREKTPWERASDGFLPLFIVGGAVDWSAEEEIEGAPPCPHAVLAAAELLG